MSWTLLQNSLWLGLLTTGLATLLGLGVALAAAGLSPTGRLLVLIAAGTVLALPPFLVTNCWMALLGHAGILRPWVPFSLYSFGGAVLLLSLMLWPVVAITTLAAWKRLDAPLLEAEPALGGLALFRHLLLPAARPVLAPACALTFVLALNQFSVPVLLQVHVLPAEVWLRFNTHLDAPGAFLAGLPLILAPLGLLLWLWRREVEWPRTEGTASGSLLRSRLGTLWHMASGSLCFTLGLSLLLPLGHLLVDPETWKSLGAALATGKSAAIASLQYSLLAATFVILAGTLARHLRLARSTWLTLLTPGILLGLVLLLTLNRPPFLGFAHGPGIVILALTLRYLVLGWAGARLADQACDPGLVDAARMEGASRWQVWRLARWPQMASPLLAATWYLTYLLCLWDVETLILVVPPGGETTPLVIFNLLHYGHNDHVNALCVLLLGLAVLPLALWSLGRFLGSLQRRVVASPVPPARTGLLILASLATAGCGGDRREDTTVQSAFFERVSIVGTRGRGPGEFNKPRSLTVDRHDDLFVVDLTGRVQRFDHEDHYVADWQMPETVLGRPKGMAVDAAGNIIVVEPHYARLNHFRPSGELVNQWGQRGTEPGQVMFPRAVAVNAAGEIWVSEYGRAERVQRFTPDGSKLLAVLGEPGSEPGQFNRPEGLCVDASDRLFVADSCNHRIQVFAADGTFERIIGRPGAGPGELGYPYDVRVDADGNLIVCEFGNSRIQ
ncbi:MAG: 6-bladed beta-propeller, partial [Verrucomicrobiae bacterium]|nr:6-bladed beta-propeller [Verrucomicrobiae bacterium]